MAAAASRAEVHGPSGFSLESIRIASFGRVCRRAWASIGSVTMRNASAADAAAERLRNERRDADEIRSLAIDSPRAAILPHIRRNLENVLNFPNPSAASKSGD